MGLAEFVQKWIGKKADWDGAQGGQSIDLFRLYCHSVLGIEQPGSVVEIADLWHNYDTDPQLHENFDKIENGPDGVPRYGDVVVWDTHVGDGQGHVAICLSGDVTHFSSLDQGWPKLSHVTRTDHNYTHVLGWMRPRNQGAVYGT